MGLRNRFAGVLLVVGCFALAAVLVIGGGLMVLNWAADGSVPAMRSH